MKEKKIKKRYTPTTKKKPKQKEKYLVNLKREKALAAGAGRGWKVARTMGYLKKPKKAIGKRGYPYAVLNNYETFYTWKEKPSKKKGD